MPPPKLAISSSDMRHRMGQPSIDSQRLVAENERVRDTQALLVYASRAMPLHPRAWHGAMMREAPPPERVPQMHNTRRESRDTVKERGLDAFTSAGRMMAQTNHVNLRW